MDQNQNQLFAGYAEDVITPPLGFNIPGYYSVRPADGIINDLHIRTIAFRSNGKTAVFISVECISIRTKGYYELRKMIADACGIDERYIYISANHSHTSFRLVAPDQTNSELARIYMQRLFQQCRDSAIFAIEDLKPATLKAAKGEAKGVGFIRRCRMKDGTVKTNPSFGNPDILRFESEHDDSVQIVRVIREEAKEIILVNFGTHADVIGGNKFCADYSGYMTEYLKGAFLGEKEVIFFNGAEGDSNHRNPFLPKETPWKKGVPVAQRMGRILAGEVLKLYDDAHDLAFDEINVASTEVQIAKASFAPEMLPVAKEMYQIYLEKGSKAPELKDYPISNVEAVRIVETLDHPDFYQLNITALKIGELVFVGIPGEPFQSIGMDIKNASNFDTTFVTSCSNGGEENAYYPSAEAFSEDGYERKASIFAPNCAKIITDGAISILKTL